MSMSIMPRRMCQGANTYFHFKQMGTAPRFYSNGLLARSSQTTRTSDVTGAILSNFSKNHLGHVRFASTGSFDGPSTHFTPTYPDEDLFSLGGYEEILEHVSDLVRYLQNPKECLSAGVRAPKGIILSGPPGVGKTHIAKAVAGHAGVPLFQMSAPEIENRYVGNSEEALRNLWVEAKKHKPCVICIDEFDSIASKRVFNEGWGAHRNSIVNQLLSLLSDENPGIVVIATTNHYEMLDSAIVRPGRFDKHIALSLPNENDRMKILKNLLKEKILDSDVDLKDLVIISSGFSGAKLVGWVNEAAFKAMKEKSLLISLKHFDQARTLMEIGVTRKNQGGLGKNSVALHEAGHAVVGHFLGYRLYKVSICQYGEMQGHVEWLKTGFEGRNPTLQDLLNSISVNLAGRAAEIVFGQPTVGSQSDLEAAKAIACKIVQDEGMGKTLMGSSGEITDILENQLKSTCTILKAKAKECHLVRDALLQNEELLQKEFLNLIESGEMPSPNNRRKDSNDNKFVLPKKTIRKANEVYQKAHKSRK